ncbi:uncharacterized protein LOC123290998 [Chrysoperla carnea]|uniref:uncharacterized protein LOC123290998 n=1 Tax=Chrysoperla carnea TaxID=189513 RepID=UPI001D0881EB|nr:uncharacterized protein LOC123290998 [Chrysoperla carnea]
MLTFQTVYDYLPIFLRSEITCLPKLINKYISKHYNNALSNSAFWLIIIWITFHLVFHFLLNALLKRMKIRQYSRDRIISSLWYSGFYAGCVFYTGATLFKNDIDPFNNFRMYTLLSHNDSVKGHYVFGYIVLFSFFVQSFVWELFSHDIRIKTIDFLFLSTFLLSAWMLGIVEFALALLLSISLCRLSIELTRVCSAITKFKTKFSYMVWCQFIFSVCVVFGIYLMILPHNFVGPALNVFIYNEKKLWTIVMNTSLAAWYITDFFTSPIFRIINHYLTHNETEVKTNKCAGPFLECILFAPRNDMAFHLHRAYSNLQEHTLRHYNTIHNQKRQNESKLTLMQTIKCMVAVQRKVKKQRERKRLEQEQLLNSKPNETTESLNGIIENLNEMNENLIEMPAKSNEINENSDATYDKKNN